MVFKKEGWPWPVYTCHWQYHSTNNINDRLKTMFANGFDSLITTLFADDNIAYLDLDNSCVPCEEMLYKPSYVRNIVVYINRCIDISKKEHRKIFKFIVGYAAYLAVHAVLLHLPNHDDKTMAYFTTRLNKYISRGLFGSLRIVVCTDAWSTYQSFRKTVVSVRNMDLMIKGTEMTERERRRWLSYKIEYVVFEDNGWTNNQKGFPVMTSRAAEWAKCAIRHNVTIVLKTKQPSLEECNKFIEFLFCKMKLPSDREAYTMRHYDVLQYPLQPYYHNLEAYTYRIFESDNPKYDEYEFALCKAFQKFVPESTITIFYIGSGRGQLIYSSMNAAKKTNRSIYIYAIEKNPYPIQSLKRRIKKNKWTNVEIVFTDVRYWKPPKAADIFLSELLGGFADNELSPECLFWAERHLTPKTICIPKSYSAYCSPISCPAIHRKLGLQDRQKYYVVSLHNFYLPADDVKKVWTFEHPIQSESEFNRYSECRFIMKADAVIHGFAGYFDCDLYDNSKLSTNPYEHTPDMHSWFPMYFAIEQQLSVLEGDTVCIRVWRKFNKYKVWYEWQLKHYQQEKLVFYTAVHNSGGASIWIGK